MPYHIRMRYFKKLAPATVEAGKPQICRVGWQAEDEGRVVVGVQMQSAGRIPFLGLRSGFSFKVFNYLDEMYSHYALLKFY